VRFALDHTPPSGEWTVENVERFPEDNRRREVLEGSLILRPSPTTVHQVLVAHLFNALYESCPDHFAVSPGVQVRFSPNTAMVPDVLATRNGAAASSPNHFAAADVLLMVEIAESGSASLDRVLKPALYAAAGIPQFWRVEVNGGLAVHTFRLTDEVYQPSGTFTDWIKIDQPWRIEIPIAKLRPRHL
jgi:Uma2 family endonuclease